MLFSSEAQGFGLHNLTPLPYINLSTPPPPPGQSFEVKLQGAGDHCSVLKNLLALDLHGVKFNRISEIFYSILHILAKIKVQVVSSKY